MGFGSPRERERASSEKKKWELKMGSQREKERALSEKKESCIKKWERAYNNVIGWGNNKKIEKIDYLINRGDKIDELM